MLMLVDCSNCRTSLQLPPGVGSICCVVCRVVTYVAEPPYAGGSSHQYYPPSPYNHAPPGQPPSVHGPKRAVICGISYKNSRDKLKGCFNDAKIMKNLLTHEFKFPESSILMLTEEEIGPYWHIPTKHNIRMAMNWLVQGCQPGDSLVFHYSGHGWQQRNYTGDEITGYDETLCPLDFETQGMLIDSEINAAIVKPLPPGVKLHAIIDAGHSGTVLDLALLCRMDRSGSYVWEDHRPRYGEWKGTSGGEVICFSGCDDNQTSTETSALSLVTYTGAMTFSFIKAIKQGQATSYGNMLTHIRSTIRDAHLGKRQEPQLTANIPFDVYSKRFSL